VEPKFEGVQVRTTPRRLIQAADSFLARRWEMNGKNPGFRFYLGAVNYVDNVGAEIAAGLKALGPKQIGRGDHRITSLMFKRRSFRHEDEVRLLMLAPDGTNLEYFCVDIDKNAVFEEITFDPRLSQFEITERQNMARGLGYTGSFGRNASYDKILHLTPIDKHWDEYG
jgi:hypothetical protein